MELKQICNFVETFDSSDKGDPFIVVARDKSDIVLGLRLTLTPFSTPNGSVWVSVLAALCARNQGAPMDPEQAAQAFSGFQFEIEDAECLSKAVVPLVALPCSPSEVYDACNRLRPLLESNYADQLITRLNGGGNSLCIPRNTLESMVSVRLDHLLPDLTPVFNETPRFIFLAEIKKP
jgi:hypothetical protein